MKRLLLDTNVVLWLLLGARSEVSATAIVALETEANQLLVSAASVWEIAIKRSLGKLTISDDWSARLAELDFDPLPITAIHAARVEGLPWPHRDPFDRLLVAQALSEDADLVTRDPTLAGYGVTVVW